MKRFMLLMLKDKSNVKNKPCNQILNDIISCTNGIDLKF
jgi:hypothetical protein